MHKKTYGEEIKKKYSNLTSGHYVKVDPFKNVKNSKSEKMKIHNFLGINLKFIQEQGNSTKKHIVKKFLKNIQIRPQGTMLKLTLQKCQKF